MLYNYEWLRSGKIFPPLEEAPRIERYKQNAALFDGDHFSDPSLRTRGSHGELPVNVYLKCASRISKVIGNFEDVVSFPTLLNYQRLMSLKMADLVCGEYPTISGVTSQENAVIKDVRDTSDFDAKLYATAIDVSRYGDAIWRMYRGWDDQDTFTCWDPTQWFPIIAQDGTNTIKAHCLCWRENLSEDPMKPDWRLNVQIHRCDPEGFGNYEQKIYHMTPDGITIGKEIASKLVPTGFDRCAIFHIRAFAVTNSVYGYDDYMPVDSILAEIMARVGQISAILDKHADPNITGPVSMLTVDSITGEYHLKTGKFYATSAGEEQPKYMTWDGQLSAAFKQLEFLINQMYILSEMGAAVLGGQDGSGTAISGTAMRFKMVNPLAKARRIANSLTRPVRQLFSSLSAEAEVPEESPEQAPVSVPGATPEVQPEVPVAEVLELPIPYRRISVFWADGLPDDPRENIENCKLASGATKLMPLETAIMEFFGRSNEEALRWIAALRAESAANQAALGIVGGEEPDPNHPGPQDGTGVNPSEKGSTTGLNNFKGLNNK